MQQYLPKKQQVYPAASTLLQALEVGHQGCCSSASTAWCHCGGSCSTWRSMAASLALPHSRSPGGTVRPPPSPPASLLLRADVESPGSGAAAGSGGAMRCSGGKVSAAPLPSSCKPAGTMGASLSLPKGRMPPLEAWSAALSWHHAASGSTRASATYVCGQKEGATRSNQRSRLGLLQQCKEDTTAVQGR